MHRFFVTPENIKDGLIRINQDEARHIEKVLRLQRGDEVCFFDGSGWEYLTRLVGKDEGCLVGEITSSSLKDNEPALKLYLAQGIAKGEKMDTIIQKAVEIGVRTIWPIACERSVVRLQGDKAVKKVERWQLIAREACKQCCRNIIPEVRPVTDIYALLEIIADRPALMLYENEDETKLKELLHNKPYAGAGEIFVLIGPEGGYSEAEVGAARQRGIKTASLGPRILRTETAALAAASIILYEYGDLG